MRIDAHGLDRETAHRLLKGCVTPRPIAWVSTVSQAGVFNAAPFSCFTFVALDPPMIAISFERRGEKKKDTLVNIETTGEFVVNVATETLAEKVNATAADFPPEVSEFTAVGITPAPSHAVKPPRIAESPVSMECRLVRVIELGLSKHSLIIGEVVTFQIRDDVYRDGEILPSVIKPLARLVGNQYAGIGAVFEIDRPWLEKK